MDTEFLRQQFEAKFPKPALCEWNPETFMYVRHVTSDEVAASEGDDYVEKFIVFAAGARVRMPGMTLVSVDVVERYIDAQSHPQLYTAHERVMAEHALLNAITVGIGQ